MNLFLLFIIGFGIGLKHAFDADHIVAVNTLLSRTKNLKTASKLGIFWGLGHTTTLFIIGSLMLLFHVQISNTYALFFELLVGLMLIFLGVGTMHKKLEKKLRKYDGKKKSYGIGLVHGIAGSAALMLLILSKIESIYTGLLYILIFGFGTILGMLAISLILYLTVNNFLKNKNFISNIAGSLSIILGLIIIYDIGFIEGLFLI